jgi:hypothetical protein
MRVAEIDAQSAHDMIQRILRLIDHDRSVDIPRA